MTNPDEFSFSDDSVAASYDNVLVPVLFQPWAADLVDEHQPWAGKRVLDLATGTGILAQLLGEHCGSVVGSDINGEMLERAEVRCARSDHPVKFVEASAESMQFDDGSFDVVVCQQGFQFFPDKTGAAAEIFRVLDHGGRAIITTWRPVSECHLFGALCVALESIGETETSAMMRVPFDFMPERELVDFFTGAGFTSVEISRRERALVMDGGQEHAVRAAYSMPIGPRLMAMPDDQQKQFRETFCDLISELCVDGVTMGQMASDMLVARKP